MRCRRRRRPNWSPRWLTHQFDDSSIRASLYDLQVSQQAKSPGRQLRRFHAIAVYFNPTAATKAKDKDLPTLLQRMKKKKNSFPKTETIM
jgi:hypothetical protein